MPELSLRHDPNLFSYAESSATTESDRGRTVDGSHDEVVYCTACGAEQSCTSVADSATGHEYADGKCKNCGEADPDYGEPTEEPSTDSNAPGTGDSIMISLATALISGMGVIALVSKKKES